MVEIFENIGNFIDNCINWITEHSICKLRGHKWTYLSGSYPMACYCPRCERADRNLTTDEVNEFNYSLHSYFKGVDVDKFDLYLQGKGE